MLESKDSLLISDTTILESSEPLENEVKIEKVDFDFLTDCDSLEIWSGGIQGVERSDSTGVYLMAQCFSNKHYDLIVYSEQVVDYKYAVDNVTKNINSKIDGASYYAYEIPKIIPKNHENEFDTYEYVYPSEVKVYKLFNDGWYLIRKEKVKSFEQLGRLKLNSLYNK